VIAGKPQCHTQQSQMLKNERSNYAFIFLSCLNVSIVYVQKCFSFWGIPSPRRPCPFLLL